MACTLVLVWHPATGAPDQAGAGTAASVLLMLRLVPIGSTGVARPVDGAGGDFTRELCRLYPRRLQFVPVGDQQSQAA